ncbi:hypothetical protein BHE74_00058031 [Ensete ventricosum]|nr:hypothetical protein BHE74_00058031 [Ensete ventricosum]
MNIPNPSSRDPTLILFPMSENVGQKALGHPPPQPFRSSTQAGCNYLKATRVTLSTSANQVGLDLGLEKERYPGPPLEDLKSTSADRLTAHSSPEEHGSV